MADCIYAKMLQLVSLFVVLLMMVENNTASHLASGPHITDVNLLLPPKMTHPVEYRLQGSDGCFKWSWDHHDILSVLPEYNVSNHCSTSAQLRSIAPYSGRKETAVYATDVHTGIVIRCKVFIDHLTRIQIFHNSIKLDLDGLATLRVRAFDSEDNVFSSLVGLQFMWLLRPKTDGLHHHLTHVPLKESPLSDCGGLCGDLNTQIKLEDSGVFSDLYVVKGTGIGHEVVSVHLIEPQFEHMGDRIVLTVAEAMSLDPPSPVFVLIGAALQYNLKVIRENIPQAVNLPSPYHQWSILNSSVAEVDTTMGLVHTLRLGVTTVTVEDTRVAGHLQMSSLHVALPDTLSLYILRLSSSGDPVEGTSAISSVARWYLVSGHQYLIQMKVFSRGPGAQEMFITENDDLRLHSDQSKFWKISFSLRSNDISAKHGWRNFRIMEATSQGLGKLTASLTYFSSDIQTKEVLKVMQEVMVCERVKFSLDRRTGVSVSHIILLPWVPGIYQEVELKATGGCAETSSDYKWFSSDMATVSVSASGLVQAKKPGKATVKVVSIFDSVNYDEVVIEVSIPSSMVMLQNFPVETIVGSHLQAVVTLKASSGAYFYRCDAFNSLVRWKAGSESFIIGHATGEKSLLDILEEVVLNASVYGPPCAWTYVYASGSGRATLHATLSKEYNYNHYDHPPHAPIILKASSDIAAFPPLIVRQAGDGNQFGGYWFDSAWAESHNQLDNLDDLYLVPGTHLDLMLVGGPERWGKAVDFVEGVEILNEEHAILKDGVRVHQVSGSNGGLHKVSCQTMGTYKVVFKRGNMVGDDHPLPAVAEAVLSVVCSFPSSIVLLADEPVNKPNVISAAAQAERNPGGLRVTPITVANGRIIRIAAVGISDSGKAFANSSSLPLSWELSSCEGLVLWDDAYDLTRSKSSWERFLVLQNDSGVCTVRAIVVGFTPLHESSENVLTDAIRLQLVSTLTVDPEFSLIFFNPDSKVNLSITGGSCYLDAAVNDSRVVEVFQPLSGLQCLQLMLAPKGLGTALVTVNDIGISPPLAASSVVRVADVDWIKITSLQEISLMEGSSESIEIIAGAYDGSTFDSSQYIYMNIRVHIEDPIIELINGSDFSSLGGDVYVPKFTIMARQLGVTTLYVSARQHAGHEILSQPIKVEVYASPRIHPDEIFLVPGASYVFTVKGGPTIGVHTEYSSLDDGIATVHKSSGRLSAVSPGSMTLLAKVYGNGDVVICQAYGRVEVGVPSSMTLNIQSEQIGIGREMPIFPSLPEGDLFSFYEVCRNYKWTVEDEEVLSFHEVERFHWDKLGVLFVSSKDDFLDDEDLGFIKVLYGRSAGRTNVAVSFLCDFISASYSQSRSYSASISLLVVSDLPLALGASMTWILPPHYTTTSLLPSSSESYSQRDSQNRKGDVFYTVLRQYAGMNEGMQKDGIFIDGDRIRTTESNSLACIQAKNCTSGKVEIASCVRVAELAQVRITSKEIPHHVINLPVGAELELSIHYCDILGNPFHEAYNVLPLTAETNYPNLVSINDTSYDNGKIYLKAIGHGRALVRLTIGHSLSKSDYMMILVGAHLAPQNPVLHLGSNLNFTVEGLNDQVFGQWWSTNESVVSVDMQFGNAQAVGEGTAEVMFKSSSLRLGTRVTVSKGNNLIVDALNKTLTNVPFPTKGYYFSVKFSDSYDHKIKALGNNERVLYDCRVDPPFVGYTKPWRDLETGNSFCLFFPYSPEHLVHSVPRSMEIRPDISVTINASLREAHHISGSASVLFIGGFSLLEVDKKLMQLNLTPESNKTIITIVGNTDVEIHWHDRGSIMINPIQTQVTSGFFGLKTNTEDFGIGGRAQFEVKVVRAKRLRDKITITLPANGQRVEIDLNYDPGEKVASTRMINVSLWAGMVGCFALLISTLVFFMYFLDRPERPPVIPPAMPSVTTPVTPDRSGPSILKEQSPRTPQPFVEYVRRTIDETPYYKREGRRRFNPQNTY